MYNNQPRQLHLELTNRCNALCPQCSRTIDPINKFYDLSFDLIRSAFDNHIFKEVQYCGNDGDPLLSKDLLQIAKFFAPARQMIHTNGSVRSKQFWRELATVPNVIVVFGIDGADKQTNSIYRVQTDFNKIISNAKTFIDNGGEAWWQYIMFEHNVNQVEQAKLLASQLKFNRFETVYSRRESTQDVSPILIDRVEGSDLECKAEKRQEIYVRSDGEVFPCPYLGSRGNYSGLNLHNQDFRSIFKSSYFVDIDRSQPTCQYNCIKKIRNKRERIIIATDSEFIV